VIAGAVAVFVAAWNGDIGWGDPFTRFVIPSLLGNIVGGVMLVAGLTHAQVVSGEDEA
jgi:formate/nitrite transporter FocA (FNT family)